MCMTGPQTAGPTATGVRQAMARHGLLRALTAVSVWFAVVPGPTLRSTSAPPPATGSPPTSGTATWVSASGGRFDLFQPAIAPMPSLPDHALATVDVRKITDYLLSDSHTAGRTTAAFFKRFGFSAGEPEVLLAALLAHASGN